MNADLSITLHPNPMRKNSQDYEICKKIGNINLNQICQLTKQTFKYFYIKAQKNIQPYYLIACRPLKKSFEFYDAIALRNLIMMNVENLKEAKKLENIAKQTFFIAIDCFEWKEDKFSLINFDKLTSGRVFRLPEINKPSNPLFNRLLWAFDYTINTPKHMSNKVIALTIITADDQKRIESLNNTLEDLSTPCLLAEDPLSKHIDTLPHSILDEILELRNETEKYKKAYQHEFNLFSHCLDLYSNP